MPSCDEDGFLGLLQNSCHAGGIVHVPREERENGRRAREDRRKKDGKVATPFNESSSLCSKVKQPVESPNTLYSKKEDGMESQNIQEIFKLQLKIQRLKYQKLYIYIYQISWRAKPKYKLSD